LWQRFVQIQPGSAEAFVNLASAFFNLRRYSEAAASAEKAMALDPSLKEAHFNAALANLILGRVDHAISILDPLVKAVPDYPAAGLILAACHACTGSETLFMESLRPLSSSALSNCLPISIADLAERLLSSGQRRYASILLQSAVRNNYTSPEISSLIKCCQPAA
jgi:predicted Zn-dependent protease